MTTVNDLPVVPSNGDNTAKAYRSELNKIQTAKDLLNHTNKWKAIWGLNVPRNVEVTKAEKEIAAGTYNAEDAIKCFLKCMVIDGPGCGHGENTPSCHAMHIVMPLPILLSIMTSQQFGVPTDIALLQLTGGVHQVM